MFRVLTGAVCASLLATAAIADDTITWDDDVNGWAVAVDRTIGNSCFALAVFENGHFLRFQFNNTAGTVQFIVGNMEWGALEDGRAYDMEIAFNDAAPWSGEAQGYHWQDVVPSLILSLPMEETRTSHFLNEFRHMDDVTVSSDGVELASLETTGASDAVSELMQCQTAMLANAQPADPFTRIAPTGDDL